MGDPRISPSAFLLGLAHSCWLQGDTYDPQQPSVPRCTPWNGHSGALLHSWSVRCDPVKFPIIYLDLRLDYKLPTLPIERRRNYLISLVKAIRACVRSHSTPWWTRASGSRRSAKRKP